MKTKGIILLILIVTNIFVSRVYAIEDWPGQTQDRFSYKVSGDHAILTTAPDDNTVEIPREAEINGKVYPVTEIGETAFKGNTNVETLYLPSCINKIGLYAFQDTDIKKIYIDDLESWLNIFFDYYFLGGNTGSVMWTYSNPLNGEARLYVGGELLDELIIPEGITEIWPFTFQRLNCRKAVIGNDVTTIGAYAFYQSELEEVEFGEKVKNIVSESFKSNKNLRSLTFNSSLDEITRKGYLSDQTPFYGDPIEEIHVPSLEMWLNMNFETYYYEDDFYNFNGQFMYQPYSLYIGGEHIEHLEIPEGIEEIKPLCFEYADIKTVKLPSTLKTIGNAAFRGSGLTSVIIPESVEKINYCNFLGCKNLREVEFLGANIKSIGRYTFADCSSLVSIKFPEIFPSGYESSAFRNCTSLKEIIIPDGGRYIGDCCFMGCESLQSISLPASLQNISEVALIFDWDYNPNPSLGSIIFRGQEPPKVYGFYTSYPPESLTANVTLFVPVGCYEIYRGKRFWGKFDNIVEMDMSTGIEGVNPVQGINGSEGPVYDLHGRRVNQLGLQPGIYIRNNRKFIKK